MEQDELGGCFVVSVEELGYNGLWNSIKDFLEARSLLQNVLLTNKVGQEVLVDNLPVQYVLSTDKRLLRLKPFSHSPVTWFRNPYAHVILVSTAEATDYKSTVKNLISKVVADLEREWGGATLTCEWVILYIRPFELDINDRNAKRVFEKLRDDFGRKKRERCVRLDVPGKAFDALGRRMPALGLEDLEVCLKEAVQASFDSRQAAYDEEVKKLVDERLEPAWSFTTLYLVKDSFALMLECAGMFEDALKEYIELEICYLEALQRRAVVSPDFGANNENDDMAQILTASWRTTRRAVLKRNGIPEFSFRQYLFAAQARLLLKLGRLLEVGNRGLSFINSMMALIAEKQQLGVVRPFLRETWAFSACLVLVATISASLSHPEPAQEELATYLSVARGGSLLGSRSERGSQSPLPALRPTSLAGAQPHVSGGLNNKHMDWDLGLSWSEGDTGLETPVLGGKSILPALFVNLRSSQTADAQQREVVEKSLYRLLGHTYLLARQQLLQLGAALQFAGPLQPRPNVKVPPELEGFLHPPFGSLASLIACYHPLSGFSLDSLPMSMSANSLAHAVLATSRSACSSPRSDYRNEGQGASFTPSTPESAARTFGYPPASPTPSSRPATPPPAFHGPHGSPDRLLGGASYTGAQPTTPRTAAVGSIEGFTTEGSQSPARSSAVPMMNGDSAAGLVLRCVSEWRLRAALEGQESFDDLLQSLTSLTAWCFARAQHWRSAALLGLEQAAMLVQKGAGDAGCAAMEQTVSRLEGWGLLHGYLLPHLLTAQQACQHPSLPLSLTRLLTLPPHFLIHSYRPLFCQHLMQAVDTAAVALDLSNSQWTHQHFVVAHTVSNTFSRLCGVHEDLHPLLVPPPRPPNGSNALPVPPGPGARTWGACRVCAGDKSYIWLELDNQLDVDLELTNVVLVLGLVLQPVSSTTSASSLHRQSSNGSGHLSGSGWQEAQDVICQQIVEAPEDGSLPSAATWLPCLPSRVKLRPGRTRLVAAIVPTQDGLYTLKHVAASLGGIKLHIPVHRPEEQELGKRGDGWAEQDLLHETSSAGNRKRRPHFLRGVLPAQDLSAASTPWGTTSKDGDVAEELVVLAVEAVRQRVECGLAAMGGRLVAGVHPQWLGLVLLPRHDTLQQLVLRLGVRLSNGTTGFSSPLLPDTTSVGGHVELFSGLQRALMVGLQPQQEQQPKQRSEAEGGSPEAEDAALLGTWVPASRSTLDLSQHEVAGPTILWMQVSCSYPSHGVEIVKVQRPGPMDPGARMQAMMHSESAIDTRRQDRLHTVSLDVSLEYVCGCPRAHSSVLTMPLHPPFHVHLSPIQVSGSNTALQVALQCGLLRGVVVMGMELTPQVGLQLASHVGSMAGLFPLHLTPTAVANVTMLLQLGNTGEIPGQQYKDEASVLTVTYTMDEHSPPEVIPEMVPGPGGRICWQGGSLPNPPAVGATLVSAGSTAAMASTGVATPFTSTGPRAVQIFQHMFVLEFPVGQSTESDLQVHLLGPWSGRVGEAVAMSWQVTRLNAANRPNGAAGGSPEEMIYFEVAPDGSNWYSICQGKGMLRLGRHAGSVATVEAVVVPKVAGSCPPPGLNLRGASISASDAYSQEIFIHAA